MSGRHRRETAGRHRARHGLSPWAVALGATGTPGATARGRAVALGAAGALGATARGRAVAVGATLGGALLTGVAGGAVAAVAGHPAAPAAMTAAGPARIATAVAAWTPPSAPDIDRITDGIGAAVQRKRRAAPGWVHPNPLATVTSCFGPRWGREHQGVDMAAPLNTPIAAAGAGVVVRAGAEGGYGNAVLIDHGNGYLTHYGHLSAITIAAGQRVRAGDPIGLEGSTGHSTGPHLHFEVHQGAYPNPVEPTRWMHEHGVDIAGCGTG